MAACEGLEPLAVAGFVDGVAGGAHDGQVQPVDGQIGQSLFERQGEVDGGLPAELKQDSMGLFTK